jgi:hypothetical protein
MGHPIKTAIGIVAVSMALALLPAVSASASVDKSSKPLCKAYQNAVKPSAKGAAAASQAAKAVQRGNWSAAKKAYLQTAAIEVKNFQVLDSILSNAPSKVKSAAGVLGDYINHYKSILENSKSIKAFSRATTALAKSAKTTAAANTFAAYYRSQCGTGGS